MKNIFVVPNPNKDVGYKVTKAVFEALMGFGAYISMPERCTDSGIECEYFAD